MPAYSFKERFVPMILNGEKTQTIRTKRKHQAKAGDPLYLFYGMRTKFCKRLLNTTCTAVKKIEIKRTGSVYINGRKLTILEKDTLAYNDGFRNEHMPETKANCFQVMFRWWKQTHALPFIGDIIYWQKQTA